MENDRRGLLEVTVDPQMINNNIASGGQDLADYEANFGAICRLCCKHRPIPTASSSRQNDMVVPCLCRGLAHRLCIAAIILATKSTICPTCKCQYVGVKYGRPRPSCTEYFDSYPERLAKLVAWGMGYLGAIYFMFLCGLTLKLSQHSPSELWWTGFTMIGLWYSVEMMEFVRRTLRGVLHYKSWKDEQIRLRQVQIYERDMDLDNLNFKRLVESFRGAEQINV